MKQLKAQSPPGVHEAKLFAGSGQGWQSAELAQPLSGVPGTHEPPHMWFGGEQHGGEGTPPPSPTWILDTPKYAPKGEIPPLSQKSMRFCLCAGARPSIDMGGVSSSCLQSLYIH